MSLKQNLNDLIHKYSLRPNKLLGQNFLIDQAVLQKIIAAADLKKGDTILEVGPGLGVLTKELAERAGRVIAVEKDKKMAEVLKNILAEKNIGNVEIMQGDILKINIPDVIPAKLVLDHDRGAGIQKEKPGFRVKPGMTNNSLLNYKLVANIPYYLTARLIRNFLEAEHPPNEIILMVQKEVAQRICAKPPKMSLLAVAVQFYAEPEIISYVSKNAFWPSPKVDSAIIRIIPHRDPNLRMHPNNPKKNHSDKNSDFSDRFFKTLHAGFAHPRKQLISNLSRGLKIDREQIGAALKKIGPKPEQRAETLSVEDWLKLSKALKF